jgi:hypothetical protein
MALDKHLEWDATNFAQIPCCCRTFFRRIVNLPGQSELTAGFCGVRSGR